MTVNKNKFSWAAPFAAAFIFGHSPSVIADTTKAKERVTLEQKIQRLEERVRRLEDALNSEMAKNRNRGAIENKFGVSSDAVREKNYADPVASEPVTRDHPEEQKQRPIISPAALPKAVQKPSSPPLDDAPQELFVMRENAVTLKPRRFELSSEIDYLSRRSTLQTDNAFLNVTTLRYGVLDWLEFGVTVPYGFTARTSSFGPSNEVQYDARGFGDIQAQLNAKIVEQSRNWPGIVVSLAGIFPTGQRPYDFSNYRLDAPNFVATPNPINPLVNYFSQGAWGIRSGIQVYKTVDPIIIFAGVGVVYTFPQNVDSYQVKMGLAYTYNMGISFAASEKTTLGFSFNGGYTSVITVNGRKVYGSSVYPAVSRLSIIQRVTQRVYLEPSLTFGMNQDVPNFAVGLGVRVRF
ncbi:transporter [Caballeronia sp. LZ029]|uniref:transporter n=1 Tax=Caballeronia sp. LZ029 TaxID=3038564 RepID=UPI00286127E6|nr:transporter [Caballeronia sp. LZ029]MDR5742510.1 transporter [Caballeronia sp. LZ029]